MELRQLRYFIAIAEEKGFHKAARRLHVAQPALSACVKQLEDEIGHRLLERSKHRVSLTAAGVELLDEARRMIAAERTAKDAVRSAAAGKGGVLRLGIIPTAMVPPVARLLRVFHQTHPGVALSLQHGPLEMLMNDLHKQELHGVIGRPEVAEKRHRVIPICTEERGLVVPEDSPLAALERIPLKRLHGQRILLLKDNPHFGRLLQEACHDAKVEPDFIAAGKDHAELLWLAAAGMGMCPCSLLLQHAVPPGAVLRPLSSSAPKLKIALILPQNEGSPTATALGGIAKELSFSVRKPTEVAAR